MSGMSGFSWPSGSPGAVIPVSSSVSPSTSASLTSSVSSTSVVSGPPVVTSGSGTPPGSFPEVSPPAVTQPGISSTMSQSPAETPSTGSDEPQTTRVRVTVTITVTPDASTTPTSTPYKTGVEDMTVPTMVHQVAASTTKSPAPEVTDVVFTLLQPSPGATASSNSGGGTNGKVITGLVVGGVCLVVLTLMLIAACRHRSPKPGKRSNAEKSRGGGGGGSRATRAAIEAAHRRRQGRNHGGGARTIGLSRADMAETFHQGNVMAAAGHVRGRAPSLTRADIELAQLQRARCRDTRYGADDAQDPAPRHHAPPRDIRRGARRPAVVIRSRSQRPGGDSPVSPVSVATGGRANYPDYDDDDVSPLSIAPRRRP
jgi:hypothetical protein